MIIMNMLVDPGNLVGESPDESQIQYLEKRGQSEVMKGNHCIWGCGNVGHNYVCVPNATKEHCNTVELCARAFLLLREARSVIDSLNANIQGQMSPKPTDQVTYAVCEDMITRIDALVK
jgi:hypothetical protein